MTNETEPLLYGYEDAAYILGLASVQALRDLVFKGRGPSCVHLGRRVFFTRRSLEEYVAQLERSGPFATLLNDNASPNHPADEAKTKPRKGRPSVRDRQAASRSLKPKH